MGTRADFYVGRGKDAEWLGSIAWDGYPDGIKPRGVEAKEWMGSPRHPSIDWPAGESLFEATTEEQYRSRLARFFQYRDDVTLPEDGWPWPWNDSNTSDYAYAFDGENVWAHGCHGWFDARLPEPEDEDGEWVKDIFPDMSARKNVTLGPRSGLVVVTERGIA